MRAVEAGANVVRSRYGSVLTRIPKEANDFATDADVDAERAMIETLRAMRPGDGISGEELGAIRADPERTWLIDPLCGTRNFAAQTPMVAVNAALRAHDRVIAAAVAAPMSGEVYSTDGQVARRRIGPQTVMITPSPRTMLVDVDMDTDPRRTAAIAADLASRGYGIRVSSTSLALAWVADGRSAAYVTAVDVRDSVHFQAGLAICKAAGCVTSDLRERGSLPAQRASWSPPGPGTCDAIPVCGTSNDPAWRHRTTRTSPGLTGPLSAEDQVRRRGDSHPR